MFDLEFSNTNRKIENKKGDIYVLGEHLGSGEFSEIYKCENKIIKLIEVQNDGDELLILNEAKIHSNLMHDNIVNFYDFIYNKNEDEERNFGYGYGSEGFLVLEYCNYKDMSNLYKLTDNITVKLGDFGISKNLENADSKIRGVSGTKKYMAPEILRKESYSFSVDIWSIGVCIYILLYNEFPFPNKDLIVNLEYDNHDNNLISSIFITQDIRIGLDDILSFVDENLGIAL